MALLPDEDSQESVQREARAEVEGVMARPRESEPALEMALLTDRLTKRGGETGRVDDRQVGPGRLALWNIRPSRRSIVYRTPCDSNGSPAAAPIGGPSSAPPTGPSDRPIGCPR